MKKTVFFFSLALTLSSQLFSQANIKLYGFAGKGGSTGFLYYNICNDVAPYTITLDGSSTFNNTMIAPGSHTLQIVSASSNVYVAVLNYNTFTGISGGFTSLLPVGTNTFTAFIKRKSNTGTAPYCNGSFTIALNGNAPPFINSWYNSGNIIPSATNTPTLGNLCSGSYGFSANDSTICSGGTDTTNLGAGFFPLDMGTTECFIATTNLTCNAVCTGSAQLFPSSDAEITNTIINGPTSTNVGYSNMPINITNQCAGGVSGMIMDATGAQTQCFWMINEPSALVTVVTKTDATAPNYNNGSYTVVTSGGTAPYMYLQVPSSPSNSNLTPGTYSINVIDDNGCGAINTIQISQNTSASINEIESLAYNIYPTITDNELIITSYTASLENIQLHVISIDGKEMNFKMEKQSNKIILLLNGLTNGVYLIKINTETKSIYKRIVFKN
jgi:hypothetical protein